MLPILRDDALASTDDGFALRLCLPWIRALPLSSVTELVVVIDGEPVEVIASLDGRMVPVERLSDERGWWFVQDRLTLGSERILSPGVHDVSVSFRLLIPYLAAGADAPLVLPFRAEATLALDAAHAVPAHAEPRAIPPEAGARSLGAGIGVDVAQPSALPEGWRLGASSFNWTPDVITADRPASEVAVGIVAGGVADVIEVELGQLWRSFPAPSDAEGDALRVALAAVGGSVSIVGASIDDWHAVRDRRTDEERFAFLLPQLRAAHRLGARGVRLPIGQAGPELLRRVQPLLEDLGLVLYEEVQGHQAPQNPSVADAYETIAGLDDPRIRLLVDISMLMPALPVSYLTLLRESGVPASLVDELERDWRSPGVDAGIMELLRSGGVPPAVHTAYMNLLVRFGRSDASDLRDVLPLTGAFHLKFWDLDDRDDRVSAPIRELGTLLAQHGWGGTLTSEWGGHEWLEGFDATDTTRAHLQLARTALAEGYQRGCRPAAR